MSEILYLNEQAELMRTLSGSIVKSIQDIFEKAYKEIGNPIALFDTSYNLLANTVNRVNDDVLWNELTKKGTFSHETVNFFNTEHFIDEVAKTELISILKSDKLKYDRASAKIYNKDGIHIANILVLACYKSIEDKDLKRIEEFCKCLSNELQHSEYNQKIGKVFEESFIKDLIEGKVSKKNQTIKKLEDLYVSQKSNLYVAVIDITNYENTLTHLAYFRDLLGKIQSEFKYYIYLNNIVAIISTNNQILNIRDDLKKLKEFFAKNNIQMGISSDFQNLFELRKYYKQALNALNYGLLDTLKNEQHIFEYDNYRIEYFLNSILDDINASAICHPVVFLIKEYDKQNNTSYYKILHTYLLFGCNSYIASEKSNMNYDKFCIQLKEISEIFDIDLNDGNTLINIFIAMKIAESME